MYRVIPVPRVLQREHAPVLRHLLQTESIATCAVVTTGAGSRGSDGLNGVMQVCAVTGRGERGGYVLPDLVDGEVEVRVDFGGDGEDGASVGRKEEGGG